jgi:hypothetical protein
VWNVLWIFFLPDDLESSRNKLSEVTNEITSLRTQLEDAKKTAIDKLEQNTKLRGREHSYIENIKHRNIKLIDNIVI